MQLLLRWIITAIAAYAAVWFLPGISIQGNAIVGALVMAVTMGFANAIIRPILTLLTCPLVLLTLGLFMLVINALVFMFAGWLTQFFGVTYTIDGFWTALLGSIIVSIVSFMLSIFLPDGNERRRATA
jgi:putative membrane protein